VTRALVGARFHLSPAEVDRLKLWQFIALVECMKQEQESRG